MRCEVFCFLTLAVLALASCDQGKTHIVLDYPGMDTHEFRVFSTQCADCHAPPKPNTHTAAEWPNVIARMQQHRIQRSIAPIPADKMASVRHYLEQYAKAEVK